MIHRRTLLAAFALVGAADVRSLAWAGDAMAPAAVISGFYDSLLATMKAGPALGFEGRNERLGPAVRRAFDLPLMTRLMVGPQWANLTLAQQQQLVAAFSAFSIATYASRFDDYSGERFQVESTTTPLADGTIVHSKLVKTDGDFVSFDYLMRQSEVGWQIIDIFLSGTVSELATRRSEFSSVLRRDGPDALVELLQRKAAKLHG